MKKLLSFDYKKNTKKKINEEKIIDFNIPKEISKKYFGLNISSEEGFKSFSIKDNSSENIYFCEDYLIYSSIENGMFF